MKIQQAVELLDVYPTLIDLTRLPKNESNEGKVLFPCSLNPKTPQLLPLPPMVKTIIVWLTVDIVT